MDKEGTLMARYDVAIIGGGPAGATVGCLLKKYNPALDVAIFEREAFPRDHVGESHLPAISPILDEMGVWEKVESAGFPIKIGGTYRWGSTDELWDLDFVRASDLELTPRPHRFEGQRRWTAFQVDRSIYDKVLLDHAGECGCRIFERTRVARVELDGGNVKGLWVCAADRQKDQESPEFVVAKYYVDCSGDSGILRRALDIPVESPTLLRNIAIWEYWQDAEWAFSVGQGGTRIQIMSLGWGWLWFIPITSTRTSVGLVVPTEYFKESGKSKEQIYRDAIAAEPLVSKLLANAKAEGTIVATKDWSFMAEKLSGENWFLAGDSCGFADPILSAGMTLAHTSGRKVAYTILELLRGRLNAQWLMNEYSDVHRGQLRHHIAFADYWYSANGNFTDLKGYCSEIAGNAGLTLDPDSAFRWLATGGFAVAEPGLARALGFRVRGIKFLADKLSGDSPGWELSRLNFFRLNLEGSTESRFADYKDGRIERLKCFRRGVKVLPVSGVYAHVLNALERNMDGVKVLEDAVNAVIQQEHYPSDEAFVLVAEVLESLIVEGWVKTKAVPSRPFIHV
jgi:flavin-dependent dehydrogenase